MSPVFAHGRLRLYLLKLLDEAPRHGYEVIRLLEERFHGLYAPSAGTVYPRLAKLEQEGLVAHTVEGGRKVYRITDAGRAELAARAPELDALESEIRDSVAQLADQIREDVRDSAKDLREEIRRAAKESRRQTKGSAKGWGTDPVWGEGPWPMPPMPPGTDKESWQRAKEEWRQAKEQAKEQTRQAKEQARSAREEARATREQTRAVRDQVRAEAHRIGEQIRSGAKNGDWPTGLADGLSELTRTLSGLADPSRWGGPAAGPGAPGGSGERVDVERIDLDKDDRADRTPGGDGADFEDETPEDLPSWTAGNPDGEPLRELSGLLDRFRDEVRDAARDTGFDAGGLARARAVLADAARRLRG